MTFQVHEPPRADDLPPPVGGRIGPELSDFMVEEVPAFPPSGTGAHLWILLEKRGWSTPDAIRAIARAASVPEREIGSAGMKDKHAITRQWLSLPTEADPSGWQLPDGLSIVEQTRHDKKLRTGQLAGNRFRIRLIGVDSTRRDDAAAICRALATRGLFNYFGGQRFGRGGDNLPRALAWLADGAPMRGKRARFFAKLYSSVVQSEVFNRYLTARRAHALGQLLDGEVVRLDGSASVFVVDDPERERPRLASRDIHLTGPLPGPKLRAAARQAAELEHAVLAELSLDERSLAALGRHAPGTRRDLIVLPTELELAHDPDADRLELRFGLPAGSYATELCRQLTGEPLSSRPAAG